VNIAPRAVTGPPESASFSRAEKNLLYRREGSSLGQKRFFLTGEKLLGSGRKIISFRGKNYFFPGDIRCGPLANKKSPAYGAFVIEMYSSG